MAKQILIEELRATGEVQEVEAEVSAQVSTAQAQAEEDAATEDQRAQQSATAAALRRAAEDEQAAAEAEEAAAGARARQAEHDRNAARAAAAEADRAAAGARERAAGMGLPALEMEDQARLTPRERAARRVARMIAQRSPQHLDPESVDLQTIAETLAVSISTAGERRKDAVQLLAQGYRP